MPDLKPDPMHALILRFEEVAAFHEHLRRVAAFQPCDPRFNDYDRGFLDAARISPA